MPRVLRPKPTDLSREASMAVWMKMEWGKCRADTRSSHTQHAHHIALDTEREGRVPHPIRPRAEPRLDTQLARPPWPPANHAHLAHVHLASRRVRLVEQASVHPPGPRRSPEVAVPAEGRRRHASGPSARTRAGECRALVGSTGRRGRQAVVHLRRPQQARDSAKGRPCRPTGAGR